MGFSLILRAFFSFPNECQFIECQFFWEFRGLRLLPFFAGGPRSGERLPKRLYGGLQLGGNPQRGARL